MDALAQRIAQSEAKVDRAVHKVVGGLNEMQGESAGGLNPTIQREIRLIEQMREEAQRKAMLEDAEEAFRQKYDPDTKLAADLVSTVHNQQWAADALSRANAGITNLNSVTLHAAPTHTMAQGLARPLTAEAAPPPPQLPSPPPLLPHHDPLLHHDLLAHHDLRGPIVQAQPSKNEAVLRQALVDAEATLQSERNRALQTIEAGRHLQMMTHEDA